MLIFKPLKSKHSFFSVAARIEKGLGDGSISLPVNKEEVIELEEQPAEDVLMAIQDNLEMPSHYLLDRELLDSCTALCNRVNLSQALRKEFILEHWLSNNGLLPEGNAMPLRYFILQILEQLEAQGYVELIRDKADRMDELLATQEFERLRMKLAELYGGRERRFLHKHILSLAILNMLLKGTIGKRMVIAGWIESAS